MATTRGATYNPKNRFSSTRRDDAFFADDPFGECDPSPKTRLIPDHTRSILTRNQSPDIPFGVSINPYRGCEHGCAYCYARPTHEYLGYSAGIDFETNILVKENAPELLAQELYKPAYVPEIINLSGVTDCYQPIEKKFELTRRCLKVLSDFKNPFTIITKNYGVTRDIDLIAPMAAQDKAAVFVTVTSLDPNLCGTLEPRTSRPALRLQAIRKLTDAGIPVGIMIAPIIPGLNDSEIPKILEAAAECGARWSAWTLLRLPLSVAPIFTTWLETHFPDRKNRVIHLIQSMRGGKLNDPRFSERMRGTGMFIEQIRQIHALWSKKIGLNREELNLTTAGWAPPPRPGDQMQLF